MNGGQPGRVSKFLLKMHTVDFSLLNLGTMTSGGNQQHRVIYVEFICGIFVFNLSSIVLLLVDAEKEISHKEISCTKATLNSRGC